MRLIFPDAIGLRRSLPHNIPGRVISTAYRASPLTLSSPSTRGVGLPTTCFEDAIGKPPLRKSTFLSFMVRCSAALDALQPNVSSLRDVVSRNSPSDQDFHPTTLSK